MATKTAVKTKATTKKTGSTAKRPTAKRVQSPPSQVGRLVRENLHWLFLMAGAIVIGVLLFWGYRKITASEVFALKKIDVSGASRASKETIEKNIRAAMPTGSVWNADLTKIQRDLEQTSWVKTATVSRVLPDGLRVRLTEREPRAVVRLESGAKVWVDDEARVLGNVAAGENQQFVIYGWNEGGDGEATKKNQDRVRLYSKLQDEWRKLEIAGRVTAIDISNLQDVEALIDQNGIIIPVQLGNQDFGVRLKAALSHLDALTAAESLENLEKILAYDRAPVARYKNLNAPENKTNARKSEQKRR